jgi:hypothetical protein
VEETWFERNVSCIESARPIFVRYNCGSSEGWTSYLQSKVPILQIRSVESVAPLSLLISDPSTPLKSEEPQMGARSSMDEAGAWTTVRATPSKSILRLRFDVVSQTPKD